jgi:hypothetical protein
MSRRTASVVTLQWQLDLALISWSQAGDPFLPSLKLLLAVIASTSGNLSDRRQRPMQQCSQPSQSQPLTMSPTLQQNSILEATIRADAIDVEPYNALWLSQTAAKTVDWEGKR